MEQNYRIVFTAQRQVTYEPCEMPVLDDDSMLFQAEISQISTGTELTMLERNVEPGTPWARDISYPCYPGYATVSKVIAVGKNVPAEYLGRRALVELNHQKYHAVNMHDFQKYIFIPDGISSAEASLGNIGTITMASIRAAAIRPGESCLVYGAGLIGQMVARQAKLAGAPKVFITDVSDFRLSKVPKDPCFIPINGAQQNVVETIMAATDGLGVNYVFETTSVPSLAQTQLECLAKRGKLIITSSPKGRSLIDLDFCSRRGLTIIGAHNVTIHTTAATLADPWTRARDTALFYELLQKNMITVQEMITHAAPAQDAPALYDMLMEDRTRALSVNLIWEAADK